MAKPTSGGRERVEAMTIAHNTLPPNFKPEDIAELIRRVQAAIQGSSDQDRIKVSGDLGDIVEALTEEMESEARCIFDKLVGAGGQEVGDVPFRVVPVSQQSQLKEIIVEGLRVHTIGVLRALNLYEKSGETIFHARKDWPADRADALSKARTGYIIGYVHHSLRMGMTLFFKNFPLDVPLDSEKKYSPKELDVAFRRLAQYYQSSDLESYFDDNQLFSAIQHDHEVNKLADGLGVGIGKGDIGRYLNSNLRNRALTNYTRVFTARTGLMIVARKFLDSGDNLAHRLNQQLRPHPPVTPAELFFVNGQANTIAATWPDAPLETILLMIRVSRKIINELPKMLTLMCKAAGITPRMRIHASNAGQLVTDEEIRRLALYTKSESAIWIEIEKYVNGAIRTFGRGQSSGSVSFQSRLAKLKIPRR